MLNCAQTKPIPNPNLSVKQCFGTFSLISNNKITKKNTVEHNGEHNLFPTNHLLSGFANLVYYLCPICVGLPDVHTHTSYNQLFLVRLGALGSSKLS